MAEKSKYLVGAGMSLLDLREAYAKSLNRIEELENIIKCKGLCSWETRGDAWLHAEVRVNYGDESPAEEGFNEGWEACELSMRNAKGYKNDVSNAPTSDASCTKRDSQVPPETSGTA